MSGCTVTYRGYRPDNPAGPRLVVIEIDDHVVGPLPHIVKHAPGGLSWGYEGSSPADLARSLLIHALGPRARCAVCSGSGKVWARWDGDTLQPLTAAETATSSHAQGAAPSYRVCCTACDDGCAVLPEVYQAYKHVVVAQLPLDGWTLPQREILDWLTLAAPGFGC
ncbi:DUF6166 domain-containing protein [Mycolicibacterium conceptionense]|uniref:DUF6166 domain-containing protein n=1 Tax=Mycolicibacterium conceptionense TaxID=451644 RepID=UPI003204F974